MSAEQLVPVVRKALRQTLLWGNLEVNPALQKSKIEDPAIFVNHCFSICTKLREALIEQHPGTTFELASSNRKPKDAKNELDRYHYYLRTRNNGEEVIIDPSIRAFIPTLPFDVFVGTRAQLKELVFNKREELRIYVPATGFRRIGNVELFWESIWGNGEGN